MDAAQLSGYLLEEVVAHLLLGNGYRLLAERDDPGALVRRGNGLRVRGRGAEHQADALGALDVPVPFSLPIRLFVEAKNTAAKVGLDVVRNAHGIVHDVNEFTPTSTGRGAGVPRLGRVRYCYSVFATGGFSRDAQEFALAHQISLIDLSGPTWGGLRDMLTDAAADALLLVGADQGQEARWALRRALSAHQPRKAAPAPRQVDLDPRLRPWGTRLASRVLRGENVSDLLLGFTDAPFVLALRPVNYLAFRDLAEQAGGLPLAVNINYSRRGPLGGDWIVRGDGVELSFPIPGILEDWLLSLDDGQMAQEADSFRRQLLRAITVFVDGRPVRLEYTKRAHARVTPVPEDSADETGLRAALALDEGQLPAFPGPFYALDAPGDADRADSHQVVRQTHPGDEQPAGWTVSAAAELLRLLDVEAPRQAALIRYAAQQGGTIMRAEIFAVAGFDPGRRLNGLVKPVWRIQDGLVARRLLAPHAERAFRAEYERPGTAYAYSVPPDLVAAVRELPSQTD